MENSVVEWARGTRSSASLIVHTNARHSPSVGKTNRQPSGGNWRSISLYTACIMKFAYSKYGGSCTTGSLFPYSWGYWVVLYACIKHNDNRIWGMLMHAYYSE